MQSVAQSEYIRLGAILQDLCRQTRRSIPVIVGDINCVTEQLQQLNFNAAHAVSAGLKRYRDNLDRRYTARINEFVNGLPEADVQELARLINPVFEAIFNDANSRHVITLIRDEMTDRLRNLHTRVQLDDKQKSMQKDASLCMECGAYRPAMVTAWILAYDYIRSWIYRDPESLEAFNKVLTSKNTSRKKPCPEIVDYEDFSSIRESEVLRLACEANLFNHKIRDKLIAWLDTRNAYAHPGELHPTRAQAMGQIDDLLDVIENKPFNRESSPATQAQPALQG